MSLLNLRNRCVLSQFGWALLVLGLCLVFPSRGWSEETAQASSVTYGGEAQGSPITFQFDGEYECGQYANGDWWVLVNPETKAVVLKSISPDSADGMNGWCVNPRDTGKQPYDKRSRLPFDPSLMPTLPYEAKAGESIVKVVSAEKKVGHSVVQNAAVLTVVASPPKYGPSAFRPPYAGSDKPEFNANDLKMDLLPKLEPVQNAITEEMAQSRVRGPRLDYSTSWASSDIRPIDVVPSWGTNMSRDDSEVMFWILTEGSPEEKRQALIGLVQYGIDLYGARSELGTEWYHGGGGNGNGRLMPFVLAATLLDSPEIKEELQKAVSESSAESPFWEINMFQPSEKAGRILWGAAGPFHTEDLYWKGLAVDPKNYKAGQDPYNWIDGAAIPGDQYQGTVSLPVKYTSLILRLIPQMQENWPEEDIMILSYSDRWVEHGAYTMPDPVAPAPKLTAEQWEERDMHGYGETWGPDRDQPGEAIKGEGRFPDLDGTHTNGEGLPANRKSNFGEAMWEEYRGDIEVETPTQ